MKFIPFRDDLIPQAAELLAQRQQREILVFSELPASFTEPAAAEKALLHEWKQSNASGIAAMEGKDLVGYMIGYHTVDEYFGRIGRIRYPCFAIAGTQSEELYRDLYTNLADAWVSQGHFDHYVFAPEGNRSLLEAWFKLGFTYQQVYGVLDLNSIEPAVETGSRDFEIRIAAPSDKEALRRVSHWICSHQAKGPSWNPVMPEMVVELADGYAEIVDDPEAYLWLAVRDEAIVGFQAFWPVQSGETNIIIPEACIELKVGATSPALRGTGIGSYLTAFCLNALKTKGYRYCLCDWHMPNLLSSRFWPQQGFRPVMHRLVRKIDPRVVWAYGKQE